MPDFSRDGAVSLDQADPLGHFRGRYHIPDGVIYLDGNSLGPMAKTAPEAMATALEGEWANGLITSWNAAGWWDLPVSIGEKLAPVIGAAPGQTVVTDSTSINIYKLLHAALALRPDRSVILTEADSFPTDLYMTEGALSSNRDISRRLIQDFGDLNGQMGDDVAVVLLSHVNYRTGALLDMKSITQAVQDQGAIMVWDLCHSSGVIPMELDDWNVDFAVGCTYKYLNGGPGAPAFIYAAKRYLGKIQQPLSGWWGHAAPFDFEQDFRPEPGIRSFLCGTQPILSMRALSAALDVFADVDIQTVRQKSQALTGYFIELIDHYCKGYDLEVLSLRDEQLRGSQVSLTHRQGYPIVQALIDRGVIGDFRTPDQLRFGFAPLYLRYIEVWDAVQHLRDILETGSWDQARFHKRDPVT